LRRLMKKARGAKSHVTVPLRARPRQGEGESLQGGNSRLAGQVVREKKTRWPKANSSRVGGTDWAEVLGEGLHPLPPEVLEERVVLE
jgi:hypothetical protein